ncbi:MAG: alkene reductase [Bacteroidota bacterium]
MKLVRLLSPYTLGAMKLKNRIVMAPMTRSRAIHNIPNDLMSEYYTQRTAAGFIITEGTSPSPNGLGYSRIPGIFSLPQIEGWKNITKNVHEKNGRIFVQLMHTGRIGHPANLDGHARILAPSAVAASGKIWTDTLGMQTYPIPTAMSLEEIQSTVEEYKTAAVNAIHAGFDGIELHAANGYLIEQFLSPLSNTRTDAYGGSIEHRSRFLLEIVQGVKDVIGKHSIGIRLSPYGIANDMPHYPEIEKTYTYLAEEINRKEILYIHIVDHQSMGGPEIPAEIKNIFRATFTGAVILSGGYSFERAEIELQNGQADLFAFGRSFINNPDLVERFMYGNPLTKEFDTSTLYSAAAKGYTDYPVYTSEFTKSHNQKG